LAHKKMPETFAPILERSVLGRITQEYEIC
jgi:hypothetical protein